MLEETKLLLGRQDSDNSECGTVDGGIHLWIYVTEFVPGFPSSLMQKTSYSHPSLLLQHQCQML